MDTYNNLCAQFYDLDKPNAPKTELEFYFRYAENAKGPIFEPMCGTGNFLIPLVERGYDVTGSDASMHMLSVCSRKCEAKSLIPKLHHKFIDQVVSDKKYALILIPSGSFGLITDVNEVKQCLKIIYNQLLPGGKFVFDIETIKGVTKELGIHQKRSVPTTQDDEKIILDTLSVYNEETQVVETICQYDLVCQDKNIQTETETIRIRYYKNKEINEWIKQAGFVLISCYKAYNHIPADINDSVVVYECLK